MNCLHTRSTKCNPSSQPEMLSGPIGVDRERVTPFAHLAFILGNTKAIYKLCRYTGWRSVYLMDVLWTPYLWIRACQNRFKTSSRILWHEARIEKVCPTTLVQRTQQLQLQATLGASYTELTFQRWRCSGGKWNRLLAVDTWLNCNCALNWLQLCHWALFGSKLSQCNCIKAQSSQCSITNNEMLAISSKGNVPSSFIYYE